MKTFIKVSSLLLLFFFTNQINAQKIPGIPSGKEYMSKDEMLRGFGSFAEKNGFKVTYTSSNKKTSPKSTKVSENFKKHVGSFVKLSIREKVISIDNQILKPEKFGLDETQVKNLVKLRKYLVVLFNEGSKDLEKAYLEGSFTAALDKMIESKLGLPSHSPYAGDGCYWVCRGVCGAGGLDDCHESCEWLCY